MADELLAPETLCLSCGKRHGLSENDCAVARGRLQQEASEQFKIALLAGIATQMLELGTSIEAMKSFDVDKDGRDIIVRLHF